MKRLARPSAPVGEYAPVGHPVSPATLKRSLTPQKHSSYDRSRSRALTLCSSSSADAEDYVTTPIKLVGAPFHTPLGCGPEATNGSSSTVDRVRLGKTGFGDRSNGLGCRGTAENTGILAGWVGSHDKKVGAGLDTAVSGPGRQQCDIARGHLHLVSSRSAQ